MKQYIFGYDKPLFGDYILVVGGLIVCMVVAMYVFSNY